MPHKNPAERKAYWQRWYKANRERELARARRNTSARWVAQVRARVEAEGCRIEAWGEACGRDTFVPKKLPNKKGQRWTGLCKLHYQRWWRNDDPRRIREGDLRYRDSDGLFEDEDPRTAVILSDARCVRCDGLLHEHEVGQCLPEGRMVMV